MKSIYSKLIFGFFITIVASFSVAGFVSLRLNDQQIESKVEEDLITTNDYVSKVISNINIENRDDIIDLYAKSSEMAKHVIQTVKAMLLMETKNKSNT